MKIAIISDIHENFHNLNLALEVIKSRGVKRIIGLGDYINPGLCKMLFTFVKENNMQMDAVFGNNDGDKALTMKFAIENGINLATGEYMQLEIENRKVFLTHYPDIGHAIDRARFDAVFYGHDHQLFIEEASEGKGLLANPGELSAHLTNTATFLMWDTESNSVETITLENIYNPKK